MKSSCGEPYVLPPPRGDANSGLPGGEAVAAAKSIGWLDSRRMGSGPMLTVLCCAHAAVAGVYCRCSCCCRRRRTLLPSLCHERCATAASWRGLCTTRRRTSGPNDEEDVPQRDLHITTTCNHQRMASVSMACSMARRFGTLANAKLPSAGSTCGINEASSQIQA
jgi:hypothetical protein